MHPCEKGLPPHQASLYPLVSSPLSANTWSAKSLEVICCVQRIALRSFGLPKTLRDCMGIMIYAEICCKLSKYNQYTELILMILTSKLEPPNKNLKQCYKLLARAPLEVRRKLHPSVVCPNDAASAFLGEAARQPFEVVYPILAVTLQNWVNVPAVMNHSSHKGIYEVDSDWVHHWDLMIQLW